MAAGGVGLVIALIADHLYPRISISYVRRFNFEIGWENAESAHFAGGLSR